MLTRLFVLSMALGVAVPTAAQPAHSLPRRVASAGGFQTPESVRCDAARNVFFVSNVAGNPSARDGVWFISLLDPGEGRLGLWALPERRP